MEFPDPEPEPGHEAQIFRCDLTWLTSRWSCIFGRGCPGISADRPDAGCCPHGAHFTEAADEAAVSTAVAELTPQTWQHHALGTGPEGWVEESDRKTRVVAGACILFNGADFATGPGCALHQLAERTGRSPHLTKPEVCWQLPVRRSYRTVELPDGSSYLETTIGEFDRRSWGTGGADFDWYCSSNSQAHGGPDSLFRSGAAELTELMGPAGYAELDRRCHAHLAAIAALRQTPGGRELLPLLIHPATWAAENENGPG